MTRGRRTPLEPIVVPRWTFLVKYALFILAAAQGVATGIPSLDLATPYGYRYVWTAVVVLAGVISFVGCYLAATPRGLESPRYRRKAERAERLGTATLVATLVGYITALVDLGWFAFDPNEGARANAIFLLVVIVLPLSRWIGLTKLRPRKARRRPRIAR